MKILFQNFKLAQKIIVNIISVLLRLSFKRNSRHFYGCYFGTDHPLELVIKNFLRPNRIIKKFIYGQIIRIPFILSAADRAVELSELPDEWKKYSEILKRDGIVFIPNFFKKRSEALSNQYKLNRQEFPPKGEYYRFYVGLDNLDVFNVAVDPMMLTILANYFGCQPYLRDLPVINCTHLETKKDPEADGFNDFWHYDTVNQMTAHILLSDVSESDNCMFYAKGSHCTHRQYISKNDYLYSEEYVNDKFKIIPCIGEAGTLVFFDSNGLHRLDLKLDTFRSHLHLNFVPGNDLIEYSQDILDLYSPKAREELATLDKYQAKSLSHLYPS
ncbi:phytanoyl-CoA dioxygenase family protein [Oceanospirillaceae bacterium]|nr:phytanoyl-CoA dioxygenase family protein [Oceanospirillaceae bacterium]